VTAEGWHEERARGVQAGSFPWEVEEGREKMPVVRERFPGETGTIPGGTDGHFAGGENLPCTASLEMDGVRGQDNGHRKGVNQDGRCT